MAVDWRPRSENDLLNLGQRVSERYSLACPTADN